MKHAHDNAAVLGEIDGALLVVRQLVKTACANDPRNIRAVENRVRYCELIARRLKRPLVDIHRLGLAAWLFALEGQPKLVQTLSSQYNLDPLVFPETQTDTDRKLDTATLAVVRCFQDLKRDYPELTADFNEVRVCFEKAFPDDPDIKRVFKVFLKVLMDEATLMGGEAGTGRILIVDPEEAVAPLMAPPLRQDGFDVKVVPDAETAAPTITTFVPHLVISAQELPVADGVALCEDIKSDPETRTLPFIMLSKHKGKKVRMQSLKAGAEALLHKPVDLEMLFLEVRRSIKVPDEQSAAGVTGSLSEMSFTDIIQIVAAGNKTMEIRLSRQGTEGRVFVDKGQIMHAETNTLQGEEAFYALMHWADGTFATQQCTQLPAQTIHNTVMALLMEGARQHDEGTP